MIRYHGDGPPDKISKENPQGYLFFAYLAYYPAGAFSDLLASCDTLKEIEQLRIEFQNYDYINIYPIQNEEIILID